MQSNEPTRAHAVISLSAVPLFHAAWIFAAGIAIASRVWIPPSWLLIATLLTAILCGVAAVRAQRIAWIPVAALWLMVGMWCAEMEPRPAPAPELRRLSDGLLRTVEGTVVDTGPARAELNADLEEPSEEGPAQRIDLQVSSLEVVDDASDVQQPASGGVRLTVRWPAGATIGGSMQPFACGERLRVMARLLPPPVYRDPGVWNRADYLIDQGITSTASVKIERVQRLGRVVGFFPACRLSRWQHAITERLLALPARMRGFPALLLLSENDAVMLAAMVAGDRTYLSHSLRVGFERTGSFHMLVVSGLHLAIVAGCIFWLAKKLRLPRVPASLVTLAASFAYALFTGFATPVARSLWMVTIYLAGRLLYREKNALNTIGFAALCLLVVSPRSLFDSSFQMTLLAVVAIAGVAAPLLAGTIHPYGTATRDLRQVAIDIKLPPKLAEFRVILRMLAERLERAGNRWLAWRAFPWCVRYGIRVIELAVISCVVELAMTLPMAVYFHRITLFALPVNLLIVPLLAALMPAALITLIALAVWPAVAVVPAMAAALVMHVGVGMVHWFGSLAMGDFRIPGPLPWQITAYCALCAAAIAIAHRSLQWPAIGAGIPAAAIARIPGKLKAFVFRHLLRIRIGTQFEQCDLEGALGRWLRLGAATALALAALAAVMPRAIDRPRGAMLVEATDVGQGDSILIIEPGGKTLLVDGGGFGGAPNQTHYEVDEGRPAIRRAQQSFDIGEEVVSPAIWARGIRHLDAVAISHAHSDHIGGLPAVLRNFHPSELWVGNNPPSEEYRALLDEAAELHIPVRSFCAGDAFAFGATQVNVLAPMRGYRPGAEPANNDSLVLHIAYGATSVLLEGDAERPVEDAMLAEPGLESMLLKVGHHGSKTSTQPEFLARVAPQLAVISCGLHNRYGHPREEVLEELEAAHVRTLRTDIHGVSCFVLDGRTGTGNACPD